MKDFVKNQKTNRSKFLMFPLKSQFQTDLKRMIHIIKHSTVQMTHLILQTPIVNGAELFQKNHGILFDPVGGCIDLNMCRQLCLIHF